MKIENILFKVSKDDVEKAKWILGEHNFIKEVHAPCTITKLKESIHPLARAVLERIAILDNLSKYVPLEDFSKLKSLNFSEKYKYMEKGNLWEGMSLRKLISDYYGKNFGRSKKENFSYYPVSPGLFGYLFAEFNMRRNKNKDFLKQIKLLKGSEFFEYKDKFFSLGGIYAPS